ncbi:MAG: RNA polymerase sigma factor [Acidimicrobiia bacterium]
MTDITEPFGRSHRLKLGHGRLTTYDTPRSARARRDGAPIAEERGGPPEPALLDDFDRLLRLARFGNTWAWSQLYAELARPVLGYLRVHGAAEPEDLLSEVFLHIVRGLDTFEGDSRQFRSWVFTIAHRRLIDERRARGKRPVELRENVEPSDAAEDPATKVIDRLTDEGIIGLLESLSPEQREVLLLRLLAGLTIDEIATAVGKTPGAVKALQRRGLLALQEKLTAA